MYDLDRCGNTGVCVVEMKIKCKNNLELECASCIHSWNISVRCGCDYHAS